MTSRRGPEVGAWSNIAAACDRFVDRTEALHFGPDHDPRHVIAENERQAIGQNDFELSVPDLGVELVEAGGMDLDQHIPSSCIDLG